MTNKNTKYTNFSKYRGKITDINSDYVRVLLRDTKTNEEIFGDLPRKNFPDVELKIGQIFDYTLRASVKMVPEHEPTPRQLEELKAEVRRELRGVNLADI